MDRNTFLGLDRFIWWVGIVENNVDPTGIGRCQVRIFGWHTDNTSQLPSKDLPWAHPMYSINTSMAFGVPSVQDWVVGFFMDGESAQMPVMMGVLPGIKPSTNG